MKHVPSEKIYSAQSTIVPSERGVFAGVAIQKDELIESCPVLLISQDDTAAIHQASLVSYMFYFGKEKNESLIALGYGSLYNHAQSPNATYKLYPGKQIIVFYALKNIGKDEEITVNYAKDSKEKLWFES